MAAAGAGAGARAKIMVKVGADNKKFQLCNTAYHYNLLTIWLLRFVSAIAYLIFEQYRLEGRYKLNVIDVFGLLPATRGNTPNGPR